SLLCDWQISAWPLLLALVLPSNPLTSARALENVRGRRVWPSNAPANYLPTRPASPATGCWAARPLLSFCLYCGEGSFKNKSFLRNLVDNFGLHLVDAKVIVRIDDDAHIADTELHLPLVGRRLIHPKLG